jgi:hypothetical protein
MDLFVNPPLWRCLWQDLAIVEKHEHRVWILRLELNPYRLNGDAGSPNTQFISKVPDGLQGLVGTNDSFAAETLFPNQSASWIVMIFRDQGLALIILRAKSQFTPPLPDRASIVHQQKWIWNIQAFKTSNLPFMGQRKNRLGYCKSCCLK